MKRKSFFDCVNIAKLLLAVSIVAMHSGFVPTQSPYMTMVCRLGVPYFFVASGFFLQRKCTVNPLSLAVKGYIKRLLLPYAVFSVVWIIQLLTDDAIAQTGFWEAALKLLQYLLFYPRGALWYVWASIIGVLMLYPFMKRNKLIHALPLGILLFAVGLLANNYYFIAERRAWLKPIVDGYLNIFLVSNNAPFVAFVFLLTGMLMSKYYDNLVLKISFITGLFLCAVSCALLVYENSIIASKSVSVGDGAFYLSQLVYVPAVFYLTTRIPCPHLSSHISRTAKNLSTGIYFLHVPILWIIHRSATYALPHMPGLSRIAPLFDHASVCFSCCLALCLIICLLAYRHPKSFICKILK